MLCIHSSLLSSLPTILQRPWMQHISASLHTPVFLSVPSSTSSMHTFPTNTLSVTSFSYLSLFYSVNVDTISAHFPTRSSHCLFLSHLPCTIALLTLSDSTPQTFRRAVFFTVFFNVFSVTRLPGNSYSDGNSLRSCKGVA